MLHRTLAILLAPILPMAALMLPLSTFHRVDAFVAGGLATVLSAFALADDRARLGGAIVAGWVALTALIFPSTLLEETLALSWGVLMLAWLAGPLSATPRVTRVAAERPVREVGGDHHLPLAA